MSPKLRNSERNQGGSVSEPGASLDLPGLSGKERELLRLYAEDLKVRFAPRTAEGYLADLRVFFEWLLLRGLEVGSVRGSDVLAYQGELYAQRKRDGKPYSISTQAQRLTVVRSFFRFLTRRGLLLSDPSGLVELPRLPQRLPRVLLSREEVSRILAMPDRKSAVGQRDRAILETLYATGIRVGELVKLGVMDVDTEDRLLVVREGKGRRDRNLPLTRLAGGRRGVSGPGPGAASGNPAAPAALLERPRLSAPARLRGPRREALGEEGAGEEAGFLPHLQAQRRHPPAEGAGRHPPHPGALGAPVALYHRALHARGGRRPAQGPRAVAPEGEVSEDLLELALEAWRARGQSPVMLSMKRAALLRFFGHLKGQGIVDLRGAREEDVISYLAWLRDQRGRQGLLLAHATIDTNLSYLRASSRYS